MKRTLNSCVTFALLLLGTLSIAELIRETVSCVVSPTYPLWVVVICLFLWVTSRMEKGLWIGIPLTGAAVFLLIRYRLEELRLQATAFITDLAGLFAGHFSGREDLLLQLLKVDNPPQGGEYAWRKRGSGGLSTTSDSLLPVTLSELPMPTIARSFQWLSV